MWSWLPAGLPSLSNRWLAVYRVAWLAAMAMALPSVLYFYPSASFEGMRNGRAVYEAGLIPAGQNAHGRVFTAFGPASRAAGIGDDEVLLAVDGTPVPVEYKAIAALLRKPQGSPVRLTLKAADGRVHDAVISIDRQAFDNTYRRVRLTYEGRLLAELTMQTATSILGLVFSTLLFLRRPRDPVAALLAIGTAVGYAGISLLFDSVPHWLSATRYAFAMLAIIAGIAAFPDGRFAPRWSSLSIGAMALCMIATEAVYGGLAPDIIVSLLFLLVAVILGSASIVRYRRTPPGITRQQIKFATLGIALLAIGVTGGSLCQIIAAKVVDEGVRAWLILSANLGSILGTAGFYIGVLISLLRHRLYDAEVAISRSAVVATLTLMLGATFAGSEKIIEVLGEQYFGAQGRATSAGIAAAVAAVLIAPLHGRVSRWAERRFQKGLIKLRGGLPLLVGDLRETASPERLAEIALERIAAGVRSTRGAVVFGDRMLAKRDVGNADVEQWIAEHPLGDNTPEFDRDETDPLLPVRIALDADGCGRVGWLLLGPRPDGSLFGKDEREVLADLADPLARALAIAASRSADAAERKEEVGALRQLISGEVGALRKLISAHNKRLNRLEPGPF